MANKTVEEIYGYAQDLLKFEGEDIGIPGMEEDRTIDWIRDLDAQLHQEFYSRGITLPDYRASHYGFDAVTGTALAADVAAGAITLTIDSSAALATAGVGIIYDNNQYDIFQHTGNAAGTVSGIPTTGRGAIKFAHDVDLSVERLYALPSDFGRMRPVRRHDTTNKNHDGVLMDGRGYFELPSNPSGTHFSVFINTSGSSFLWLPKSQTGQSMVHYDLAPNTIDGIEDEISFPDPFHMYHVWGLVAIFKQVQDEDYVPVKEQAEQMKVIRQIIVKRSAGKPIRASRAFFGRYR